MKPTPTKPCCGVPLVLVEDLMCFTTVDNVDGVWKATGTEDLQPTDAPDSVRLFCPSCGEYYFVPLELDPAAAAIPRCGD